ncbi:MAG: 23S rRNA (pseudouridine(1915)-N(3))-methyltransferase RlmH [Rickettsiaceae bacterium]|nr:23S rRNA (pseudouridine(1915)-N(3))-methyltransferase RlmH [Rickettsiaceae bacterium]
MKIQIISVGKVAGDQLAIIKHYQKMINWRIQNTELAYSKKLSEQQIRQHEAKIIQDKLTKGAYLVVLDLSGKQLSSESFAGLFSSQMMSGKDIDFVIGGAFGLDDSIISRSDAKLCLSKMTFPHQIAKILLFEQIYRAQTIMDNHPYHK